MQTIKIYGRNPVTESLNSDYLVKEVYLDQVNFNLDPKLTKIYDLALQKQVKITLASKTVLEEHAQGNIHQGVVAFVKYDLSTITQEIIFNNPGIHIYVRETTFEQNLGAIIRTAECAGIKSVIIPPKQEITGTIARTSMGAVFHIPVYQGSLFPTIKAFKENQFDIIGIERGGQNVFDFKFNPTTLLIIGGEDHELSQPVVDKCDNLVSIPQFGKVNSLNMSVAAGIVMYAAKS